MTAGRAGHRFGPRFGRAIAVGLARRGADVVAVDLAPSDDTLHEIETLGRGAVSIEFDVSDPDAVAGAAGSFASLTGAIDILVNNAGVFPFLNILEVDFDQWKRTQSINVDSQFLMSKAVMSGMRERGWGRIANMASNSLGLAVPDMVPYMASKGAVIGFTRALATDLAPFGITVNAVCPSASRTPGEALHR